MSLLLGSQRAPDRLGDRPGYATNPETYRRLETLTGVTATDLWAATIHRFAPTLMAPGRTAVELALPGGVTLPLLDTGSLQKRLRAESRGAFCPRCLAEAAYHRLLWVPVAVSACLRHRSLLVHRCGRCGAPPTVRDIVATTCRACGADLTTCSSVSVEGDALGLFAQQVMQSWLLSEPLPRDSAFPLPDLPAKVAYRIVDGLRLLVQGAGASWPYLHRSPRGAEDVAPGFFLTPAQSYSVYATALKALLHWPRGFHEFLDAYTARDAGDGGQNSGGLAPKLGTFYSAWVGRRWRHEAFDFLQEAFDQYLLDRYGRVHSMSQLGRCHRDSDLAARLPFLNLTQAARIIGTRQVMLGRLLRSGHLTGYEALAAGRPGPPILLSRTEVLALREAWHDQLKLTEASDLLGVSYWVVTDLIACGFLPPPHQLAEEAPRWRFTRAAITACHARVAARVIPLPPGAPADGRAIPSPVGVGGYVTLAGAARILYVLGLNAAALLARVADGKLPAYHPATTPVRLGDLLFTRTDVAAHAAMVKAENSWLDRLEAAHRLGITGDALQRLVERGLLTPVPVSGHAHFFDRAMVDAFGRDHVTSGEAAALLGVGRIVVQKWTRRGRLHAVSGPGVDDSHSYLFNRSYLVQWRTDQLTFGEAAALLGVTRSTLAGLAYRGKIAPLADMGGKQRWFSRQEIERLRQDQLQEGGSAREPTRHHITKSLPMLASLTNCETQAHCP